MRRAHIRGALVGVESVTPEGLKAVYKDFNDAGEALVDAAAGVPATTASTCSARSSSACRPTSRTRSTRPPTLAQRAGISFAQFVMLQPFPGTVDFAKWEKEPSARVSRSTAMPLVALLADPADRAAEDLHAASGDVGGRDPRRRTQATWDGSTACRSIWQRSGVREVAHGARWRSCCISKLYRQMYANTGIATDSARVARSARARACSRRSRAGCSSPSRCRTRRCRSPRLVAGAAGGNVVSTADTRIKVGFRKRQRRGHEDPYLMRTLFVARRCTVPSSRLAAGRACTRRTSARPRPRPQRSVAPSPAAQRARPVPRRYRAVLASYARVRRLSVVARGGKMTATLTARDPLDPINGFEFNVLDENRLWNAALACPSRRARSRARGEAPREGRPRRSDRRQLRVRRRVR